jgi:hypothetical protein
MKKFVPVFLLSILSLTVFARIIVPWTEDKMQNASDLIVIGTVVKVTDLDETNTSLWTGYKFRGVETTFNVSKVLKGNVSGQIVILHHYSFKAQNFIPPNAPSFINLTLSDTNQYLLYLVKDGTNRFAPVSGQLDPAADAVRKFPDK